MKWRVFEDQWGKEDFPKDGKGRFYFVVVVKVWSLAILDNISPKLCLLN